MEQMRGEISACPAVLLRDRSEGSFIACKEQIEDLPVVQCDHILSV
jgi:hypothetical protein